MDFVTTILIIVAVILLGLFALTFSLLKKLKAPKEEGQALTMLQNQMNEITRTLDQKLGESTKAIREQFGHSANIIRDVTEKLTRLDETNKQVISFADQLKNLQDILKNPKQRGILGEYYLETVLKNVLPPNAYQMQYPFKNGEIVDAAVFWDKKIIPVDSKFSLENYTRILETSNPMEKKKYEAALIGDIKNRIDETSKYVRPEEGTMDFAFMFIPSEALYYDLLINKVGAITENTRDLIAYAGEKRVYIVSATTFLAFLQTVLQGLRNQQISEKAKDIIKQVENLRRHLGNYETFLERLGKHMETTVNTYNIAYKEFGKIDKDVLKITGEAAGIEPLSIEGPSHESEEAE